MAKAKLVAQGQFSSFGTDYTKGDEVLFEHYNKWPEGTLVRRLEYGDVKYVDADDDLAGEAFGQE